MTKAIYFDMDGTIANLYGVKTWLDDILAESVRPYENAEVMINMNVLARKLNKLQKEGYKLGIISWTAKNGKEEYNNAVAKAKKEWLNKHLKSVRFDDIKIVPYGTPKAEAVEYKGGILFDDEELNRKNWFGVAYNVNNILEVLGGLN